MKQKTGKIVKSTFFETLITVLILLNSILIGVETSFENEIIHAIQISITYVFVLEIILRWISREDAVKFFKDGWNLFDLSIVLVSLIPESLFADSNLLTIIRVLRVFRILRLLNTSSEIKLIVSVLFRSISALTYNALFFGIFMYLFSVIGVTVFQLPDPEEASPEVLLKLEQFYAKAPNAPIVSPDPYGDLGESMFTLFRILTGEDWTDIRYNLVAASDLGLINSTPAKITIFHVIWYILSAFLLINLVLGAILNNYNIIMEENRRAKEKKEQNNVQ